MTIERTAISSYDADPTVQSTMTQPVAHDINSDSQGHPDHTSILGRFRRTLHEDLGGLHPTLILANMVLFFLPDMSFNRLRTAIFRACGSQIDRSTLILGKMTLTGGGHVAQRLRIGRGCTLNSPLHMDLNAGITIGNDVCIGHHVVFITSDHETGPSDRRCSIMKAKQIVIEDGCWIGARSTILPGVTIGRGSVVSAGAVVAANVAPNRVVVGNPARPVKSLEE